MKTRTCYILLAVVTLLVILVAAYEKKWLNGYLPADWRKQGFVGAYGRTPAMEGCIAYGPNGSRYPMFNRCTWV